MKLGKILAISLLSFSLVGLASCKGDVKPSDDKKTQEVDKISIAVTGATKTVVGGTVKFNVKVTGDSKRKGYTATSSDESVATISSTGLLTAVKEGTTKLTFASKSDSSVKKEIDFTVVSSSTAAVRIEASSTSVKVGGTVTLTAKVTNTTGDAVTYDWKVKNYLGNLDKTDAESVTYTADSDGEEEVDLTVMIGDIQLDTSITFTVEQSLDNFTKIGTADDFKSNILKAGRITGEYMLTADIDLGGMKIDGSINASDFAETLDGRGYKISNFTIAAAKAADHSNSGMFGTLSGTVRNAEIDGTLDKDSLGWGTAILCNTLTGTVTNCLFQSTQTFNNGSDSWFPFGASIAGILKESATVTNSVITVSGEGKDVHQAVCAYPAGGAENDKTGQYVPSKQTFTVKGIYTSQVAALAYGSAWEWGGPIEDKAGITPGINFASTPKTAYKELSDSIWNLEDNVMPTLKKL